MKKQMRNATKLKDQLNGNGVEPMWFLLGETIDNGKKLSWILATISILVVLSVAVLIQVLGH